MHRLLLISPDHVDFAAGKYLRRNERLCHWILLDRELRNVVHEARIRLAACHSTQLLVPLLEHRLRFAEVVFVVEVLRVVYGFA